MKKARKAKAALIKPDVEVVESVEAELYKRVRSYIAKARAKVYAVANKEMVAAYWNVGREIVEKQGGEVRGWPHQGSFAEIDGGVRPRLHIDKPQVHATGISGIPKSSHTV